MKQLFRWLLVCIVLVTMMACSGGSNGSNKPSSQASDDNATETTPSSELRRLSIEPEVIGVRVNRTKKIKIEAIYSDGTKKTVNTAELSTETPGIAEVDDKGKVTGKAVGETRLIASIGEINATARIIVANEINTTNLSSKDFGYRYIDAIPLNATKEKYDDASFAMVAGFVRTKEGNPLEGVEVGFLKHPEYGSAQTDSKGKFAIAVEGAEPLIVRFRKNGYITVDRKVMPLAQDWTHMDDVVLLPLDEKVTAIELNASATSMHTSTPVTDDRGERATTLVFDGVSKATVTSPDGSVRQLTHIGVRATEFEVPESMPGDLPNQSAYTYCSDLTIDGVGDDENVTFDAPVVMYVDNFLGFDVGEIVPIGYYDRQAGEWKASDNGLVVQLLDTDGDGKVDALDSSGDGQPDDLNGNGIFSDEVAGIADNDSYASGKTYWRAEITHFTPWDHNWPYGPPEDADNPDDPDADSDDNPYNDCNANINSYVTKKSRIFHEDIPVAGTDITLHYSSKRVAGYTYVIDASVDTSNAPASVVGATVTLDIAGRRFTKEVAVGELNHLTFEWDGKDALGYKMTGEVKGTIKVAYKYHLVYYRASRDFAQAWAQAGSSATNIVGRDTIEYVATKTVLVNVESSRSDNSHVANGWSLSNVHDLGINAVYKGDGTKIEKETSIEEGLIAYYRFEGDTKDSSGNGNNGNASNISYTEGIFGEGAYFNGQNSFIDITLQRIKKTYSVSMFVKFSSTDIVENQLFYLTRPNYQDRLGYLSTFPIAGNSWHWGSKRLNRGWEDRSATVRYADDLENNRWYHTVFVLNDNNISLYIDGKLLKNISSVYGSDIETVNIFELLIGGTTENYQWMHGVIDEFKFYNKALTPDEIMRLYEHGLKKIMTTKFISLNISDHNLEYQFNIDGKHLATSSFPDKKLLETFTYDEEGHVIAITDRFGQITTIERDARGYPVRIVAPNGQVTELSIDENGDLVEVRYEDGSKYAFTYFEGSLMDTMTDPNGNVIRHRWNDVGRIVEEIDGMNGSYRFLRDASGSDIVYTMIRPEGETSTSSDVKLANGDMQSTITLPTGENYTATFAADKSKTVVVKDGVTTVTNYTTDTLTRQRIVASREVVQPSGLKQTVAYATVYDGNETHTDSKTQTVALNGKSSTRMIDYNNGTDTVTTPTGRQSVRTYDVDTLLTQEIKTGTLTSTTYAYDDKGRVIKVSRGARETRYAYDSRGNIAAITDPRGHTTTYEYDVMDRLVSVTYPGGITEHFSYDKNGNLLTRTVPTPAEHTFAYNGGNLRTSYASPLNKVTTYNYNRSKNLTSIVKPSGKKIENIYENGKLARTVTPEGTMHYAYLFGDKIGSVTNGSESIHYGYDGTLLTSIAQSGVLDQTVSYAYNNDFLVVSTEYAGKTESYAYDDDGLLIRSGVFTLTRDAQNGYVTRLSDGTLTQSRSYNDFGEVTRVSDDIFAYEIISRDTSGAIAQKKETLNGSTVIYEYLYDALGRLSEVRKDSATVERYAYDANGNRAEATVYGKTYVGRYTLDDNVIVYGDNTYRYDDDGYLVEKTEPKGSTQYVYNTLGALTDVTLPDGTQIRYHQDALNRRVAKEVNGTVVEKYLWEDLTTLLAVYDGSDRLIWRFEYADQRMPVAMTDAGGAKYYLHYDQVGSIRAVSDTNGNIVKEIIYDTFGNILSDSNPSFKVPFGFAGGLYDPDMQLTHFGYREYDSFTGKWTAKDPIGFRGGDSNLYGYVLNDPVNLVDPLGLAKCPSPKNIISFVFWLICTAYNIDHVKPPPKLPKPPVVKPIPNKPKPGQTPKPKPDKDNNNTCPK